MNTGTIQPRSRRVVDDFKGTARFEILGRLGEGGMGVVYRAFDRELGQPVALKLLPEFSGETVLRFKAEFQTLQDIHHPNLVSLGELFGAGDRWFFTMELVNGIDFLSYVRPGRSIAAPINDETVAIARSSMLGDESTQVPQHTGVLNEARLRATLVQLVQCLAKLHAAQKVHRDVKPSNILVDATGRVVVLDFGIVMDTNAVVESEHEIVGTIDYMAPEQAQGGVVGAASDWYSVGTMLYQALTGVLPFTGKPFHVFANKQLLDPVPPREVAPDAPADLCALCMDLLARPPAARPHADEILRRLRGEEDPDAFTAVPSQRVFVGRQHDFAELARAFEDVREGKPVFVFVQGVSGIGKSALVRQFVETRLNSNPHILVLSGRCYERASVPYKALDGIMDALSDFLVRLRPDEVSALLPERANLLLTVFPVLGRVDAFSDAPQPSQEISDLVEFRARIFSLLRVFFANLTRHWQVVLCIDDMQWSDADSLSLLRELVLPPDAPAILYIATERTATESSSSGLLTNLACEVRDIHLAPLDAREANELAKRLLSQSTGSLQLHADAIASEAAGHPMFIDELVRHVHQTRELEDSLRLDDALRVRISRLDPTDRRMLETIAVAGMPIAQDLAAAASGLEFAEFNRRTMPLRAANLVRTGGAHASALIEPYHDRIRETVVSMLDAESRRVYHERIATAMESAGSSEYETLATHWHEAKVSEKATKYALLAAEHAERALAFAHAARLIALALELCPNAANAREWRLRQAESLANAGRGAEAADAFLLAIDESDPRAARELRRRAADQCFRVGQLDRGMNLLESVLASVGEKFSRTRTRVVLSLLYHRARLGLRGTRFKERPEIEVSPQDLARIDVTWSLATGLAMVDPILASEFEGRNLLLALDAGEPYRVARAFALETTFIDAEGPKDTTHRDELAKVARELAFRMKNPIAIAYVLAGDAERLYNIGLYARALPQLEDAIVAFSQRCTGAQWETTSIRMYQSATWFYVGKASEAGRHLPRYIQDAHERGDVFASAVFRTGLSNSFFLVQDDPERARNEADAAMVHWTFEGFHVQHYYHLLAHAHIELYLGRGRVAHDIMASKWSALQKSLLLRVKSVRMEASYAYGRCALAAAAASLRPGERNSLLKQCRELAKSLEHEHTHHAAGLFARMLFAGIELLQGKVDQALERLEALQRDFSNLEMKLFGATVQRLRGRIMGGMEGQTLVTQADLLFGEEGVRNPERYAYMLLPDCMT